MYKAFILSIQDNKNRSVKVLFQGGGDYTRTQTKPQRQPECLRDLPPDQEDMVTSQVANYQHNRVNREAQCDKVTIIDDENLIRQQLLAATTKPSSITGKQTHLILPDFFAIPNQMKEMQLVKEINSTAA